MNNSKMFKFMLAALILLSSTVGISAGGQADSSEAEVEGTPHFSIDFVSHGDRSNPDAPFKGQVAAAINEKLEADLGFTADINRYTFPNDAYEEKIILDISTGQSYDIARWGGGREIINLIAERDLAMPLDDLLAEHAPELLASIPDNVWDEVRYDGKIYAIPQVAFRIITGAWYRNDWFRKLGLEAPSTLAEFEVVLEALKTGDPDGNGMDDTIPLAGPFVDKMFDHYFLGLFTDTPGDFIDAGGNVMPKIFNPGYKEMILKFREWYAKGYINDLIFEKGFAPSDEVFGKSKLGISLTNQWNLEWGAMKGINEANPDWDITFQKQLDAEMKAYYSEGIGTSFWFVPVTSDNPEEALQYFNWVYTDKENHTLVKNGIEGVTYVMEDNLFKLPEQYRDEYTMISDLMDDFFMSNNAAFVFEHMGPPAPAQSIVAYQYCAFDPPLEDIYIPVTVVVAPAIDDNTNLKSQDAEDMAKEYIQSIIKSENPVSDWEVMLSEYEELGGLEKFKLFTEEYNK